jgi:DNA-binding beta-propeller fold protein YncE
VALVLAAVVAVVVALARGGEPPRKAQPPRKGPAMLTIQDVGHRPNGVAIAGNVAWVTSNDRGSVVRIDAASGRRLAGTRIGAGATSIVADGDGVWVALKPTHEVVRIDAAGKVVARVGVPGEPTRLAVGFGSLWVGTTGNLLIRYGRDGRERGRTPIPHGIVGLATGQGHVWIGEKDVPEVLRLDPRGANKPEVWTTLADTVTDVYDGGGQLWATLAEADSITRISTTERNSRIPRNVGHRPLRMVAAGGRLYVTVNLDDAVAVIDPESIKPAARALSVPHNPYAITAEAHALWVTGVGEDTLTRIPYG